MNIRYFRRLCLRATPFSCRRVFRLRLDATFRHAVFAAAAFFDFLLRRRRHLFSPARLPIDMLD